MRDANDGAGEGLWVTFEAEALPHVPRLFRLAMWLERNRSDAEDLVQETLAQALQSFHRFEPGTNCRAWLVTIMYHLRANRLRARARLSIVHDEHHHIADTVPIAPSVPDRLTGPLADVLMAGANGASHTGETGWETLERLERDGLFLMPLDANRRWFRYHRLFADYLRERLGREHAELVPELYRRAAAWHEQEDMLVEAIDLLMAAPDHPAAAALIARVAPTVLVLLEATHYRQTAEAGKHNRTANFGNERFCAFSARS